MPLLITLLIFTFWVCMFCSCFHYERQQTRLLWILIMICLNVGGAIIYCGLRWLPYVLLRHNSVAKRLKLQKDLRQAISDIRRFGKASQYVKLGHIYQEMGHYDHALAAYQWALSQEQNNVEALWGSATIEHQNRNLGQSAELLNQLLKVQSAFKSGEASLRYGQVLYELGMFNLAQQHLQNHAKQWNHPEASWLIKRIQAHLSCECHGDECLLNQLD